MKKFLRLLPIIGIAAFVKCTSAGPSMVNSAAIDVNSLVEGTWILQSINGQSPTVGDYTEGFPELTFNEEGKLSGFTGCNNLTGSYTLEGNRISIGQLATTRKMCPGNGEKEFLEALNLSDKIQLVRGKLVFYQGNNELMAFIHK